jgi:hypothetical protein
LKTAVSYGIAHCQLVIVNCFAGKKVKLPAKQLTMTNWQWAMGPTLFALT